jgi:hypothetical protein
MGADREAALLRSGRAGRRPGDRAPHRTVYEVPRATRILDGGTLTRFDHEAIAGSVGAGRHLLRVRWNRYWRVASGAVCVEPTPEGLTTLVAARTGRFSLEIGPGGARCGSGE